jgi:curved DNA-binding protein CbpA
MPFKDHFQTLRVSHRATPQQVQKAYYDRLKLFHPDYYQDDPQRRAIAETEAKYLNEAFEVLGSPDERRQYITEWERHQDPARSPERRPAPEHSLADVKADLNKARLQVSELKLMLGQRDRELEAANLGVRQAYGRVNHLQDEAQHFETRARELQELLRERDLELQRAMGCAEDLERDLAHLQSESEQARQEALQARQESGEQQNRLAEAVRALAERKLESDDLQRSALSSRDRGADQQAVQRLKDELARKETLAETLRREVAAGEEALRLRQAQLDARTSEVMQLHESATLASQRAVKHESRLAQAALETRMLQERLAVAEGAARRDSGPVFARAEGVVPAEEDLQARWAQIRELGAALAQRTEEARQAQQQVGALEEKVRILAAARRDQTEFASMAGPERRQVVTDDRAAGWLTPQRATSILAGLMLALCAVAVTLVLLTVSIDLPALASGLSRLVPTLAGQAPR